MKYTIKIPESGFTIFELFLLIMIVGIAAAMAIPSYQANLLEEQRLDAKAALTDAAMRLERHFRKHNTYTDLKTLGFKSNEIPSVKGHYTVSLFTPTPECPINKCYALSAIPAGAQTHDKCGALVLTSAGQKKPKGCW